jgi:hypothetical protein
VTGEAHSQVPPAAAAPGELAGLATGAAELDAAHAPPGAAPAAEPEGRALPPTHKIVEMVLAPTFVLLAPNWKVSKDEVEQLSIAYGAVIDKYFPDLRAGPELAAVLISLAVFTPRVMAKVPRKLEAKKPDKPAEKKPRDDEPIPQPAD